MDIIPGQAKDFTHTQRAGKGKVHCHIELAVRTLIQGGTDHIRIPDIPLLVLRLWEDHVIKRISRNDLPPYRLLERTAEELDDLLNGLVADIGSGGLSCFGRYGPCFLQGLNVPIHHTGCYRLYLHITDDRVDVVGNQSRLAVIHRDAPLLFPVEGYEVI